MNKNKGNYNMNHYHVVMAISCVLCIYLMAPFSVRGQWWLTIHTLVGTLLLWKFTIAYVNPTVHFLHKTQWLLYKAYILHPYYWPCHYAVNASGLWSLPNFRAFFCMARLFFHVLYKYENMICMMSFLYFHNFIQIFWLDIIYFHRYLLFCSLLSAFENF